MAIEPWIAASFAFFRESPELRPSIPSKERMSLFLGLPGTKGTHHQRKDVTKGHVLGYFLKAMLWLPTLS